MVWNKKNIFLLLSLFINTQNIIVAKDLNFEHAVMCIIGVFIGGPLGWYMKPSTIIAPQPNTPESTTNITMPQYEPTDILNQQITALMTTVYENSANTIEDFDRVQKLKEVAETKEFSPASLTVMKEALQTLPSLKSYGNALEHLNALACNRQQIDPEGIKAHPQKMPYLINKNLSTKDQITELKNNMYTDITNKQQQEYTSTLALIKNKSKDQYSDKILETLLECLTGSKENNTDLTLARYNKCESAAQVQHTATNS